MRPMHQHVFCKNQNHLFRVTSNFLLQEDTCIYMNRAHPDPRVMLKVMRMLKLVCCAPPTLRMVHLVFSDMALRSWKQLANACPSTAQKVAVSFWRSTRTNTTSAVRNALNGAHHRHTRVYHRISAAGLPPYAVRTIHLSSE